MVHPVRSTLQRRYSAELNSSPIIETISSNSSLLGPMIQPVRDDGSTGDEIDKYWSIGAVKSSGLTNVLSRRSSRKASLPALYQMAMDYCGTLATPTPSERVNSSSGREFTCTRQSLSSFMFIMTMRLRSWMCAGILKVPANRAQAAAAIVQSGANDFQFVVQQLEMEQRNGTRKSLTMGSQLPHNQFADMVFDAESEL